MSYYISDSPAQLELVLAAFLDMRWVDVERVARALERVRAKDNRTVEDILAGHAVKRKSSREKLTSAMLDMAFSDLLDEINNTKRLQQLKQKATEKK